MGDERELELVGSQGVSGHLDGPVVIGGPVAGLGCTDHLLHLGPEAWSENPGIGAEQEVADLFEVLGQFHHLHVHLVADEVCHPRQGIDALAGNRQVAQGKPCP